MKKAVVLLSGGLDSATCLAIAVAEGYICSALSFDYGQKHRSELIAATNIAADYKVERHEIITLSIGQLGGSALTDSATPVPDYAANSLIPVTYVPARNTIMLSIALGFAEIINADTIFIGVSSVDYSGYPDCRPEYIKAFSDMAALATKRGIEGNPITINTPLINLSKAETIQRGISLKLDYAKTVSCYQATDDGLACGRCDSCYLRKKGFSDANAVDTTRYSV